MALPKLNETPKYEVTIPSTGKTVRFRPYLVKEEKVLMMAFESGDQKASLRAIVDTIQACVVDDLDVENLATFDIEYLFTQIRSKSVGESSTLMIKCSECEKQNEYKFDVSTVKIEMPKQESVVELTPSVTIELGYPTYKTVMNTDLNGNEIDVGFEMAGNCIKTIRTEVEYVLSLKKRFINGVKARLPEAILNGGCSDLDRRTYTLVNLRLPITGDKATLLLFHLDLKGIACSQGSACQSGSNTGSHVLRAIAADDFPSLRFSFSIYNTVEEVDYVIDTLASYLV